MAQQQRVLVQGDMRLITQAMDPAYPVNESALDGSNAVLLSPGQAFIERPIGRIEGVCMETDLHANFPSDGLQFTVIYVENAPESVKGFLARINIGGAPIMHL
jgi:hypothetical protein